MTRKIHIPSVTVWVVKEWYVWPFAWLLARRNYIRDIYHFITKIRDRAFERDWIYDNLHILSHGNRRRDPSTGQVVGHYISMGGEDRLDTSDFDEERLPRLKPKTNHFLKYCRK